MSHPRPLPQRPDIKVLIPAYNEEQTLPLVLADIPRDLVSEVVVTDNNSTDRTAAVGKKGGATIVFESKAGYGAACLRGMAYLASLPEAERPDIVVFMDADFSDHGQEMQSLVRPIVEDGIEMVIGSRSLGECEPGAMTVPQRYGNLLAVTLMRWIYGARFTDLGPYRAIRYDSLMRLDMADRDFGWTVEMQLKAAKKGLRFTEVPVSYRVRPAGESKVSGTVKGTVMAGYKILYTIFKYL